MSIAIIVLSCMCGCFLYIGFWFIWKVKTLTKALADAKKPEFKRKAVMVGGPADGCEVSVHAGIKSVSWPVFGNWGVKARFFDINDPIKFSEPSFGEAVYDLDLEDGKFYYRQVVQN